jgi:hypothetical protein
VSDPFLHDDAAYVLGALRGPELVAFEEHLATCAECQARVAEIRPVAAVLADLTIEDVASPSLIDPGPPPDTLLPGLLAKARHERRRRWVTGAIATAAAACIVTLIVVFATGRSSGSSSPARAMTSLVATPVSATAQLDDVGWGTRISLACRYDNSYPSDAEYRLVVTDRAGHQHDAGSWQLVHEGTTHFTGGTAVKRSDISRIDITVGSTPILQLVP